MDMFKVVDCLKNDFGLGENHCSILKVIISGMSFSAGKLAKETNIPITKIYKPLNELISYGMILKTNTRPSNYYLGDFKKSVVNYLKREFKQNIKDEFELLSCMNEEKRGGLVYELSNTNDYIFSVLKLLSLGKSFRIVSRDGVFPMIFYTEDEQKLSEIRTGEIKRRATFMGIGELFKEAYRYFWENYRMGNSFLYIMSENTFRLYEKILFSLYNEEEIARIILSIKENLRKFNVSIRVIKGGSYYNLYITEKLMMFAMLHSVSVLGIVSNDQKMIDVYSKFFDDMWANSNPIEPYLNEIIHNIFKNGRTNKKT